jgi:hypothetical protein
VSQVSKREVQLLQKNIENIIGVLLKVQNSDYNESEKLSLFITCARVFGRVGLWCTTLNHNYLPLFLWRCSFGYDLDLDLAIDYLLKYAMEFLNEIEITSNRILGREFNSKEEEVDNDDFDGFGEDDSEFGI